MSRFPIFSLSLLFMLNSCQQDSDPNLVTINVLDGLKQEKEFPLSLMVDRVEYVKLETSPQCMLPEGASYYIGKKYIIIYQRDDPAWIKLFDRKGNYLRDIGRQGKGPFEFLGISAVVLDADEKYLVMADMNGDKLQKFSMLGDPITEINYMRVFGSNISRIEVKSSSEIFILLDTPITETQNFYLIRVLNQDLEQIDSLFPVNSTALPVKGGYTWGHGDFYMAEGTMHVRPYSYDTLYRCDKGRIVPKYYFPIENNHLPGPYTIYGIHKGNYSEVTIQCECGRYLILSARLSDQYFGYMIYDKQTEVLFSLAKYTLPPPYSFPQPQFINDIDGVINPRWSYHQITNNQLCYSREITELKDRLARDSLGMDLPKFPDKRKEMIQLIESSNIDDNPILQIFHLKQDR